MKIDASTIDSPLALIALFVAIIELFLIFPVTKLEGRERLFLVLFIIGYPVFIAGSFFLFLWNKPVNLYRPQTLPVELQQALLPEGLQVALLPDRASIAALGLEITALKRNLLDIADRMDKRGGAQPHQRQLLALQPCLTYKL